MNHSNKNLILKNTHNNSFHVIKLEKRISYTLKHYSKKYHGRITGIIDNSVFINEKEIKLDELSKIHNSPLSLNIMRITGVILLLCELLILLYGFNLLSQAKQSSTYEGFILSIVGAMFMVIGIAGDFLGVIPFLLHTRTYDLEKNWKVSI